MIHICKLAAGPSGSHKAGPHDCRDSDSPATQPAHRRARARQSAPRQRRARQARGDAARRRPSYDPTCLSVPGNPRAAASAIRVSGTFAFEHDLPGSFPAMRRVGAAGGGDRCSARGGVARVAWCACSPRHDLSLPELAPARSRRCLRPGPTRPSRSRPADISHVQVFETRARSWAARIRIRKSDLGHRAPADEPARSWCSSGLSGGTPPLLADYADEELARGERLVVVNDDWLAMVRSGRRGHSRRSWCRAAGPEPRRSIRGPSRSLADR